MSFSTSSRGSTKSLLFQQVSWYENDDPVCHSWFQVLWNDSQHVIKFVGHSLWSSRVLLSYQIFSLNCISIMFMYFVQHQRLVFDWFLTFITVWLLFKIKYWSSTDEIIDRKIIWNWNIWNSVHFHVLQFLI